MTRLVRSVWKCPGCGEEGEGTPLDRPPGWLRVSVADAGGRGEHVYTHPERLCVLRAVDLMLDPTDGNPQPGDILGSGALT